MKLDDVLASITATTALPAGDVKTVVDALFATITKAVADGEKVSVPGLGVFQKRERPAGERVMPKTGAKVAVAAASFVVLKPSRAATGRPKKPKSARAGKTA